MSLDIALKEKLAIYEALDGIHKVVMADLDHNDGLHRALLVAEMQRLEALIVVTARELADIQVQLRAGVERGASWP